MVTGRLARFKENVAGEGGKIIDFLPTFNSSGDLRKLTDLDVIINSWKNILLTPLGSWDHDPSYGSILYKLLFDPADEITRSKIENEIYDKLNMYDNRAKIKTMSVNYLSNRKGFSVTIVAEYNDREDTLSLTVDETLVK